MEGKVVEKMNKVNININIINNKNCEGTQFPFTKYIVYCIKIITGKKTWEIKRRYKSFHELHQKLRGKKIENLPKFPPKKIFLTNVDRKERQDKLEKYLNELLIGEDVYKHNEIFEFIEMEKEFYLMLQNFSQEGSTKESSPCSSDKVKSFINLRKKSSLGLLNENIFNSSKLVKYEKDEFEIILDRSIKNLIFSFLEELNKNTPEKCKIIRAFEEKLIKKKMHLPIQRDEIFRLFFGERVDDVFLHGLIYHSGNIKDNQIGAECCLEFLSRLIDYQHSMECDNFINILKLAKLPTILQLNLGKHLKSNKKEVISSSYIILKTLINEEKGISLKSIVEEANATNNFQEWLLNIS